MRQWVFLTFLLLAAWQDMRERRISVWLYVIFGGVLAIWRLCGLCEIQQSAGTEAFLRVFLDVFCSLCLGVGLAGISILTEEGIGMGDAMCFVVSSFAFGFWENMLIFAGGLFLCSGYGVCRLVWSGRMCLRREPVAFLPFLLPAVILLTLGGFGG